ncbi:alpha-2-macroglobulin-like protein 1 isoform X2 [Pelobates fuscus]|uniref:alpha-2-macroglobulin-like protein 1 isoform X2 n=1 Tax=Pelobates fuscus TaxID=191477 RepID=UPI002FE45037
MQLLLVFASLFIFCSAAEETSEPHYVVIVPSQLSYPSTEKTCVVFYHLKGPVNFKIEMNNGNSDSVELVTEDKIDGPIFFQCYSFQVPATSTKYEKWNFKISGEADGLKINRTKTVSIVKTYNSYIIQTDKYIYTPGQAVHFRIVTLDRDFNALNEKLPLVEIMDPKYNRIGQWRDISPKSGISDFSFQLSEDLEFGDYTINIPKQKSSIFSVAKFIPQKIELKINLPWKIVASDESFSLEICGRYTFGKPVKGYLKIYVCELLVNPLEGDDDHEDDETKHSECQYIYNVQTNSRGCFTGEIDIRYFNLSTKPHIRQLTVSTSIKEKHTGLVEKASSPLRIGSAKIIYFEDLEYYYYRGNPYNGVITVIDKNKKRMPNEVFYLIVKVDNVKTNLSLVTNEEGVAHFELDTTDWVDVVKIKGVFNLEESEKNDRIETPRSIFPFYSPRKNVLKVEKMSTVLKKLVCNTVHSAKIEYRINVNDLPPELNELSVIYVLSSRKSVALHGEYKVDIRAPLSGQYLYGSFPVNFTINKELFPYTNLLVFTVLRNGNMIGDYTSFSIPSCFVNQVKLEFSEKVVHPRKKVGLEITAESGSICSIRSVDKGQLLHRPFEQLSKSIVQNMRFGYGHEREEKERVKCLGNDTKSQTYFLRHQKDSDMYTFFMLNSLKIFTNTQIYRPVSCSELEPKKPTPGQTQSARKIQMPTTSKPKYSIHKFSPETWLYDLISIGTDGHEHLNITTPNSVTSWVTDVFCLGSSGYGETEPVELTTFKPYFLDLSLPYSVVQGEAFTLTALVYNYLKRCIVVSVSLSESLDFSAVHKNENHCICEEQSTIFTWDITANKIGYLKLKVSSGAREMEGDCTSQNFDLGHNNIVDTLEKTVIVKPSGVREDKTETYRLCPAGGVLKQEISLNVPDIWVPGSERADIIVFGDILNNAIANVDDIIELPTGCGEQNMARAAVSLHILQYLNNTKRLTPEIENRLLNHLTVGYQKQLTFQAEKGSYSIFSGENGNDWLTAFVVKCLSQAQNFIYIDEKIIQDSVKRLSSLQLPNGCFNISGNYYNNRIQDEETREITFTAFVTIALMESGNITEDGVIVNALSCLRKGAERVNNTYTESLLAYVFSLSGDNGLRQLVLEDLEKKATKSDLFKHWEIEDSRSGNIEISSYILLALLEQRSKEIEEATKIMNWILQQQNVNGGFSSTQDTVVAFQAMSGYAKSTFVPRGDTYVNVQTLSGFQEKFIVDKSSNILQQKAALPDVRGEYTVTVTGSSCIYLQTHLQYHIPVAKVYSNFALSVSTLPSVCTLQAHASFDIVAELSYTGNRASSNMVIVEAELLSGFIPKKSSVTLLLNNPNVKKTEIREDKVIIYLSELTHETQTLSFSIKQITHVNNLRPAAVMIYDYYEPEEYAVAEYTFPCEKEWGHCPSNVSERKECGYPSISSEECVQRHCCYDSSVSETPRCFFRKGHTE